VVALSNPLWAKENAAGGGDLARPDNDNEKAYGGGTPNNPNVPGFKP
jgi:hypothetical protein